MPLTWVDNTTVVNQAREVRERRAPGYHSHSKILHGYTNPRSFMAISHGVFVEAVAAGKDGFSAVQDFLDGTELKHGHPIRNHILARIAKEHPSG